MKNAAPRPLTDSELLLLGLLAEMPRHGYDLEHEIERRGLREWTQIGFSSVYYVLGKLEELGFVRSKRPSGPKAKKTFRISASGRRALARRTRSALREYRPGYSSLLLGMTHWPVLERDEALDALRDRRDAVEAELRRISDLHFDGQPLPDHVDRLFDYTLGQLRAEAEWIERSLAYMESKPWLEG